MVPPATGFPPKARCSRNNHTIAMKKILRKQPEAILIILAIVFLVIIIAYFSWGIGDVVGEVNRASNASTSGGGNVSFNLKDAQALDWRGLVK